MSTGPQHCGECGQAVYRVRLQDGGTRIDLDPQPVIGGTYTFWNPTYGQQLWLCKPRPVRALPPRGCFGQEAKEWDGRKAADGRRWFVQHVCGLTAAEVVEERRRRKGAESVPAVPAVPKTAVTSTNVGPAEGHVS